MEHPKLKQLRKFIDGRRVFFLANGPSLVELETYIDDMPKDVLYCAHNVFLSPERILEKIGRRLDIVFVSAPQTIEAYHTEIREFLERDDDNLFVTSVNAQIVMERFEPELFKEHWDKIIVAELEPRLENSPPTPSHAFKVNQEGGQIFSFVMFLLTMVKAGADDFVLFGIDGGRLEGYEGWYYGREEDYPNNWFGGGGSPTGYGTEVPFINGNWDHLLNAAGLPKPKVLNCCPDSHVTCFDKIDYEDLI